MTRSQCQEPARDPRIDPLPGDMLRNRDHHYRRVIAVGPDFVKCIDSEVAAGPSRFPSPFQFRKWAANATVIRRGEDGK